VRASQIPGLAVMPASVSLAGAEIELIDLERREHRRPTRSAPWAMTRARGGRPS
jgi:chromosome partitioning protein